MRKSIQYKTNMFVALGIVILFISLVFSNYAQAADAFFSWTPNDITPTGYKIYYGKQSRVYDAEVDVGLPEIVDGSMIGGVTELVEGETYYFAATAYTETEESDYSVEVVYTVPLVASVIPEPPMVFGFNKVVLYTSDGTKRVTIEADGTITIEDM